MLSKYGKVAIAEIAFYAPLFLANTAIAKTRSFDRRTAWIYLEFLAIIRLIGASVQLQTEKTPRKSLITVAAIASSVGIAPLLLFMNWHLRRITASLAAHPRSIPRSFFTGVYAGVVVAVILAIVGGATATYSPIEPFHAKTTSKIAIVFLIVIFLGLIAVNVVTLFGFRYVPKDERTPLLAVTAGIPFFASRLVYSAIAAYASSRTFSPVGGDIWVLTFMSVLEEFCVVIVYSVACIKTPRADTEATEAGETHESGASIRSAEGLEDGTSQMSCGSGRVQDGPEGKTVDESETEDTVANTSPAHIKANSSSQTTSSTPDNLPAGTASTPIKKSEEVASLQSQKSTLSIPPIPNPDLQTPISDPDSSQAAMAHTPTKESGSATPTPRQKDPDTQLDADNKSHTDAGNPFAEEISPADKDSALFPPTRSEGSGSEERHFQDSSGDCKGGLDD